MALPIILIDSTSGSDTTASGAGPSTALSGTTNASTDAAGTTVTLPAGTDLTNVATDGSHVIFLNDSTASARNFGKITSKAGSGGATPTVVVADAFGINLTTKSWAIGGRRASLNSTTSVKLFSNTGAAGDALPGWIVEWQSSHVETFAATFVIRRAGDQTNGPITLRGAIGAATPPVITFSSNTIGLNLSTSNPAFIQIGDDAVSSNGLLNNFELQNTNGTKTASVGIAMGGGAGCVVKNVGIKDGTNKWWKGITGANAGITVDRCQVGNCALNGITCSTSGSTNVRGCRIFSNGGDGILTSANCSVDISWNVIYGNTGNGINAVVSTANGFMIDHNTINGNTGDGIKIAGTTATVCMNNMQITSNQITNNTGFGLNFTGASITTTAIKATGSIIAFNNNWNNSAGQSNLTGWVDTNGPNADPGYTNSGSGDFRITVAQQSLGYDVQNIPGLSYRSYADIGAWQHQPGGGGSILGC